jgi:hypothetical protein
VAWRRAEARARHGEVAPDVRLPEGGRLRDRLGRGFVVVAPIPTDRVPLDATTVVVGPDTPYGADRAWIVRPDGYLAASAPLDAAGGLSIR